jgi:undecaprenyl-diphosphatase
MKFRPPSAFLYLLLGVLYLAMPVLAQSLESTEDQNDIEGTGLNYLDAVVLGVVEGLTEYLPVSSTGHLILVDRWLSGESVTSESEERARNAYLIIMQGGAILAVLLLYWARVKTVFLGILGRDPEGLALGTRLFLAFLPAAGIGLLLKDWIEAVLFNPGAVCLALAVGAFLMIAAEWSRKKHPPKKMLERMEDMNLRQAITIGLMQCLAMWPGMSRSMMTIVAGYRCGLSPKAAAEFSFLLGLITLGAASAYSLLRSWRDLAEHVSLGPALMGVIVATIVAFVAVKWFVGFLSRHGLLAFAIYRLILASAIFFWIIL